MEENKVSVKIYGQEYVIAGQESRNHIMKVADYVDTKMHEIAASLNAPISSLAVLAAVNAADDYFTLISDIEEIKKTNMQLENDARHYVQLWEEAKKSFVQYKEDAQIVSQQKEDLQKLLMERDKEIRELKQSIEGLQGKVAESASDAEAAVAGKLKEMESNCFDLEMENIQLKAELDRIKKGNF